MSEKIERKKREAEAEKDVESEQISSLAHMQIPQTARESRSWCEDSFGVFCMLFNAMKAEIFTSLDYKKTIQYTITMTILNLNKGKNSNNLPIV